MEWLAERLAVRLVSLLSPISLQRKKYIEKEVLKGTVFFLFLGGGRGRRIAIRYALDTGFPPFFFFFFFFLFAQVYHSESSPNPYGGLPVRREEFIPDFKVF